MGFDERARLPLQLVASEPRGPAPTPQQLVRFLSAAADEVPHPALTPAVRPDALSYVIKRGDTLWALARRFGTDVATLARLNGIKDPDKIKAGASLKIPVQPPPPELSAPPARPDPGPPVARPMGFISP